MTEGFAFDGIGAELTPTGCWRSLGDVLTTDRLDLGGSADRDYFTIVVNGLAVGSMRSALRAREIAHTIQQNGFRAIVAACVHSAVPVSNTHQDFASEQRAERHDAVVRIVGCDVAHHAIETEHRTGPAAERERSADFQPPQFLAFLHIAQVFGPGFHVTLLTVVAGVLRTAGKPHVVNQENGRSAHYSVTPAAHILDAPKDVRAEDNPVTAREDVCGAGTEWLCGWASI